MSNAYKVILGITEDDLHRATQAIAEAIDAVGDSGSQPVDRLAVERATQTWLGTTVEGLIDKAAFYALAEGSPWRDAFHTALMAELERVRGR